MQLTLLLSVFVVAACGLVYELIAGSLATYLLGDSVTQFSLVIGLYLFAMGGGSYLSRYLVKGVVRRFISIEILVGLVGGSSAAVLYWVYALQPAAFQPLLYAFILLIGLLVGLEIPLVMRILKRTYTLKDLVSQVLTFDYIGALLVSIAFPLLLVPHWGLIKTAFLFGILNVLVALWAIYIFRAEIGERRWLVLPALGALAFLGTGLVAAEQLTVVAEKKFLGGEIIYAEQSRYQRVVVNRWHDEIRLFLNGNLQFNSRDEHRYHEALVHPGLATLPHARRVLILGGGDGMAAREVLKYPQVESVTLVDLDANVTRLFRDSPLLRRLNHDALHSPKVTVVNADAFAWLENNTQSFDFIIIDFPDPSQHAIGKLYTTTFYKLLERHLSHTGWAVMQATSPLFARQSFWCVVTTLESVGFRTFPYHANVPSFGEWGYILIGKRQYVPPERYTFPMRYLTPEVTSSLFQFPQDMSRVPADINRLDNQILVHYFEAEWGQVTGY